MRRVWAKLTASAFVLYLCVPLALNGDLIAVLASCVAGFYGIKQLLVLRASYRSART